MFPLSNGVNTILARLGAYSRPDGDGYTTKSSYGDSDYKVSGSEDLKTWFSRCCDALGGVEQLALNDNIAVIGKIRWKSGILEFLNLQAIVAIKGDVSDLYLGVADARHQYFRLDYDLSCFGSMFKEPVPHLHTAPKGPPRIAFAPSSEKTVIIDFLELLYLNYSYSEWLIWARQIWQARYADGIEEINDPFNRIVEAYAGNQRGVLVNQLSESVTRLKELLLEEKKSVSIDIPPLHTDASLLSYR